MLGKRIVVSKCYIFALRGKKKRKKRKSKGIVRAASGKLVGEFHLSHCSRLCTHFSELVYLPKN